jgi:hypothetical protein
MVDLWHRHFEMVCMRTFVVSSGLRASALALTMLLACSDDDDGKSADDEAGMPGGGHPEAGSPGSMDGGSKDLDAGRADAGSVLKRLPQITPLVRAAAPAGLGGRVPTLPRIRGRTDDLGVRRSALDSADFKSRFFTEGPTSVYRLLGELDKRIDEINASSANSSAACITQPSVPYTVEPFGRSLTFHAQCTVGTNSDFFQFGEKEGTIYLYIVGPVQHAAVRLTPVTRGASTSDSGTPLAGDVADAGGSSGAYRVDAWLGLGYNNAGACGPTGGFDGCSYGVMELHTEPLRRELVLSVAGIGFGYCGAQLKSDGERVFGRGSLDMGMSCPATSDLCVLASDLTTPAVCSGDIQTFGWPALGRKATMGTLQAFGASMYPGGADNQIVLDGTATDSLDLGPSAPAEGVGTLSKPAGMSK